MKMLKEGMLNAKRGDCIVFNNTSAEHSATYDFTSKMKNIAEQQYQIPFFWTEYQTYEDSGQYNCWQKKHSYRLINDHPYDRINNPSGYKYRGEVFEEMLSLSGYLPNRQSRSCTLAMKIFVTNAFLSDWLAQKDYIERLGHHYKKSMVSKNDTIKVHRLNQGQVPEKILFKKRKYVNSCAPFREKQFWQDFTGAQIVIDNPLLNQSVVGNQSQLYGNLAVDYISCLGIRSDEKQRLYKIQSRIQQSHNIKGKSLFNQPQGEEVYAMLVEENITKKDVIAFWNNQSFNLHLPDSGLLSNCVYCPLKGTAKLQKIAQMKYNSRQESALTPEHIQWWINIEKKYIRNLIAEKRKILSKQKAKYIGFFGSSDRLEYKEINKKAQNGEAIEAEIINMPNDFPCNCTD